MLRIIYLKQAVRDLISWDIGVISVGILLPSEESECDYCMLAFQDWYFSYYSHSKEFDYDIENFVMKDQGAAKDAIEGFWFIRALFLINCSTLEYSLDSVHSLIFSRAKVAGDGDTSLSSSTSILGRHTKFYYSLKLFMGVTSSS